MPKPICVKCQRFYRPHHTGKRFIEGMPRYNGALPGTQEPDQWMPYKLWIGDEWKCHGCGSLIIVGTGRGPMRERHHDDFDEQVFGGVVPLLQVNDC